MALLEEPGVFTMLVPDGQGWAVTRSGRTFELTRAGDDAAAHISLYERDGSVLGDDEAATLLDRFVSRMGADGQVSPQVLKEDRSQHRAVARFVASDQDASSSWLVFVVLWRSHFLMCSCTGPEHSPALDDSELMFASIVPPKKGLFRRR